MVAYRSESLDTVVMHRIVAVDGDRFVIQGDNNDFLDADRPTEDQLLGTLFRQVPQGGKILDAITSPWSVALIVAAVLGVFSTNQRGPRAGGRHSARPPGPPPATARRRPVLPTSLPAAFFSMPTRAQARQVGIGAGVVAVLAAVGWRRPARPALDRDRARAPRTSPRRAASPTPGTPGSGRPTRRARSRPATPSTPGSPTPSRSPSSTRSARQASTSSPARSGST